MVWYGVVWYGMVWYGLDRCKVVDGCFVARLGCVGCGVVRCTVVSCGVPDVVSLWSGWIRCGMVWYGVVWYGMVWYGLDRCEAVDGSLVSSVARLGCVVCGVVRCTVVSCGVPDVVPLWSGWIRCGMVWCGMVWYGMVWLCIFTSSSGLPPLPMSTYMGGGWFDGVRVATIEGPAGCPPYWVLMELSLAVGGGGGTPSPHGTLPWALVPPASPSTRGMVSTAMASSTSLAESMRVSFVALVFVGGSIAVVVVVVCGVGMVPLVGEGGVLLGGLWWGVRSCVGVRLVSVLGIVSYLLLYGVVWCGTCCMVVLWYGMVWYEVVWYAIVFNGLQWTAIVFNGLQWTAMDFNGL